LSLARGRQEQKQARTKQDRQFFHGRNIPILIPCPKKNAKQTFQFLLDIPVARYSEKDAMHFGLA